MPRRLFLLCAAALTLACTRTPEPQTAPADRPALTDAPASPPAPATPTAPRDVDPAAFSQLLKDHPDYVLLDVRTPAEFSAGHIPGATNLDVQAPDADGKFAALDRKKSYLVYCGSGRRSSVAVAKLAARNVPTYNMVGGYRAWTAAGLPTSP